MLKVSSSVLSSCCRSSLRTVLLLVNSTRCNVRHLTTNTRVCLAHSKTNKTDKCSELDEGDRNKSLLEFHPRLAQMWLAAASSKLLQPQHVTPCSRKLVWWRCPECAFQFNKRVDLHVACGGECPHCHSKPSLHTLQQSPINKKELIAKKNANTLQKHNSRVKCQDRKLNGYSTQNDFVMSFPSSSTTPSSSSKVNKRNSLINIINDYIASDTITHRCRPNNSLPTLEAENSNRISKSVSDGLYLRQKERRILLPMLAKQYEKESHKIADDEIVYVSPKLDGVRCIAAYDANNDKVLFFSRSGTLFECCDAKIEPALHEVFRNDPSLVLDGELYNDSVNLQLLAKLTSRIHSPLLEMLMTSYASMSDGVNARDRCKGNNSRTNGKGSKTKKVNSANLVGINTIEGNLINKPNLTRSSSKTNTPSLELLLPSCTRIIKFEQLMSAIRTTRDKRTPEIAALQRELQYHVFDVLYAKPFDKMGSPPYEVRYEFLSKLITNLHHHNLETRATRSVAAKQASKLGRERSPSSSLSFLCETANTKQSLCTSSESNEEYDMNTIKLVPSLPCMKHEVNAALRAAMKAGYEGVMVRRNCLHGERSQSKKGIIVSQGPHVNTQSAKKPRCARTHKQTAHTDKNEKTITSVDDSNRVFDSVAAGYAYGQRSATLLKYKLMQDDEFTIVSAVEGKGKWKGQLGAFLCQTKDKRHTFTVAPASSDREKQEMWHKWEKCYKGKALTVQFQQISPDGVPRFPVGKCIRGAPNGADWIECTLLQKKE